MTVSTGSSSNIGGPQQPQQREIETTAWTEVNKQALGIVADTLAQVFTDLNPRYNFGYLGGFGYRSSPDQPLLDHPLENARIFQSFKELMSDAWKSTYQDLMDQFPPDMVAKFVAQQQLPFEQRQYASVALDNVLTVLAQGISGLKDVAGPIAAEGMEAARMVLNLLLPFAALNGGVSNGNEISESAHSALTAMGSNNPNFDGLNNTLTQMDKSLNSLSSLISSITTNGQSQLSPDEQAFAGKIASNLTALSDSISRVSTGSDLQILQPMINALATVAGALSLPNTGSAPLYLGMSLANLGINTQESSAGMFGPAFASITNSINLGIENSVMPGSNLASGNFLNMLVTTTLAVSIGLATLAANGGMGIYPTRDPAEANKANFVAFQAVLGFAAGANVLGTIFGEMAAAAGATPKAQESIGNILTATSIMMMSLAGTNGGKNSPSSIVEFMEQYINLGITTAEDMIAQADKADEEKTQPVSVTLRQSAMTLDTKDYDTFFTTWNTVLESLGTSSDDLNHDIQTIADTTYVVLGYGAQGNMDPAIPQFINIS